MSDEDEDRKFPSYSERVWNREDSGEWTYIGEETLIITFDPPLKLNEKDTTPLSEITLCEPTGDHISVLLKAQKAGEDDVTATLKYIAANSGNFSNFPRLKKMRARDIAKCSEFLAGFTPPDKALTA